MKICFFNYYHNGDLLHSKPFVRDVIAAVGAENVQYAHERDPKVLQDLGIEYARLQGLGNKTKSFYWHDKDVLFLNTWIGAYDDMFPIECTLNFNMKMWELIYRLINTYFGTSLTLGPVENYMPYVDYSHFKVDHIDEWLKNNQKPLVLFSNGSVLSNQCDYNGDMRDIIIELAEKHPDKMFLTTNATVYDHANLMHTSDIINSDNTDLNEISYLSRACRLIIGRNSGPFCFASTGENLSDPSKIFFAFGARETDCFTHGIPVKANYVFEKYDNWDKTKDTIRKLISLV